MAERKILNIQFRILFNLFCSILSFFTFSFPVFLIGFAGLSIWGRWNKWIDFIVDGLKASPNDRNISTQHNTTQPYIVDKDL